MTNLGAASRDSSSGVLRPGMQRGASAQLRDLKRQVRHSEGQRMSSSEQVKVGWRPATTHAASKRLARDEMLHHSESSDTHGKPVQKQNQTSDMPKNKSSAPVSATDAGESAQSSWRPPDTHSATGRISTAMKEETFAELDTHHELQDDQGRAYYYNQLSGQVGGKEAMSRLAVGLSLISLVGLRPVTWWTPAVLGPRAEMCGCVELSNNYRRYRTSRYRRKSN